MIQKGMHLTECNTGYNYLDFLHSLLSACATYIIILSSDRLVTLPLVNVQSDHFSTNYDLIFDNLSYTSWSKQNPVIKAWNGTITGEILQPFRWNTNR